MGNTASCTPYRPAASAPVVRVVVDRNGCVSAHEHSRRQQQAMGSTAAELVLDYPGLFVCDSSQLEVGCRISGLPTEEELRPSRLYLLLPMNLLYSVLTEEEMVTFSCNSSSSSKRKSFLSRKIFPVLSELCLVPSVAAEKVIEKEHVSGADTIDDGKVRQRSWRPALDTIEEDQ